MNLNDKISWIMGKLQRSLGKPAFEDKVGRLIGKWLNAGVVAGGV